MRTVTADRSTSDLAPGRTSGGLHWRAAAAGAPAPHHAASMDAYLLDAADGPVVVADGVSATPEGGAAAALAVREFRARADSADPAALRAAVRRAQEAVRREHAHGDRLAGATTLCAAVLGTGPATGQVAVVQVGDSRCYRLRGSTLELLTTDHTLGAHLVAIGATEAGSVLARRMSSRLNRYLGDPDGVEPDITVRDLVPGDRLLLATDGVHGVVPHHQLATALARHDDPTRIAADLVELAVAAGSQDDATALVVLVDGTVDGTIDEAGRSDARTGSTEGARGE